MLVGASSAAWAEDPLVTVTTVTANQSKSINNYTSTWTLKDASNTSHTWTVKLFSNNQNSTSWNCIKAGNKNASGTTYPSIATDFAIADKISKVSVNMSITSAYKENLTALTLEVSTDKDFAADATTSYAATNFQPTTASDVAITVTDPIENGYYRLKYTLSKPAANGGLAVYSLSYYGVPEEKAVATPTFTMTEGEDSFSLAIACETEGASIYYTTDDSTPSAESTLYSAPLTFTDPAKVKAIAVKDGESSNVDSYEIKQYLRADFADFLAGDASGDGVIKNTISAIYQNGSNLYVKANDTYMLVYGSLSSTLSNGDTFPRLAGTYTVYNGTPEFTNPVIGEVTTGGAAVEPEAVTDLSTLSSADCNKYVVLKGVSISGLKASDADDNTITIYNKFGLESIPEGSNLDVTGIVNYYVKGTDKTLQVYPISVEGNIELGDIEADDAFEDGEAMITEGTTLIFKANNAEAMVLTDADGETVVSAEGNTLEWTPEYGVYENYKVTATLGEASKEFAISYLDVEAKVVGDVVATYGADGTIEADGEVTVKQGAKLNFTAENALHVKLVTTDADNAQVVVAEAEGDALTWSPADVDADGTMYEVIAYRYEESAAKSMAFILYVEEAVPQESYDVFVDFSNQSWDKYSKDATITWTSEDTDVSGNPFSFATSCSIAVNSNYALIRDGLLRVYATSYNLIKVNAPTGYQISAVTFSVDTDSSNGNIPYVDGNACTAASTDEGGEEEGGEEAAPRRAESGFVDYSYEFDSAVTSFELEPSTSADESATANKNMAIASATITVSILPSAINTIAADSLLDNAAPVEYYNLQGQRVSNPANGLFIRRQGNNVTKVVIR